MVFDKENIDLLSRSLALLDPSVPNLCAITRVYHGESSTKVVFRLRYYRVHVQKMALEGDNILDQ